MKFMIFFNELDFQQAYVRYLSKMHVWLEKKRQDFLLYQFSIDFLNLEGI